MLRNLSLYLKQIQQVENLDQRENQNMTSQPNERAIKNCIEQSLTEDSHYKKGNPSDFDSLIVPTEQIG